MGKLSSREDRQAPGAPRPRIKWLRYVLIAVGLVTIFNLFSGPSGLLELYRLGRKGAAQEDDLLKLQARKAELELERNRLLKDSSYIELLARKELGMARPEEKVFRFMPPEGSAEAGPKTGPSGAGAPPVSR